MHNKERSELIVHFQIQIGISLSIQTNRNEFGSI